MTRLKTPRIARLDHPRRVDGFPFAETIDVATAGVAPDEPSPCLPSATAVWYLLEPPRQGTLTVDLVGSTPHDAVVRLYRRSRSRPDRIDFLSCASPIWNGQLSLEARVHSDDSLLAQVGTSESLFGSIVVRVELHEKTDLGRRARHSPLRPN